MNNELTFILNKSNMSDEEQKWNTAVQIGFGDEIGPDDLNDYWPSSTQSPGLSPESSPDSQQHLEPAVSTYSHSQSFSNSTSRQSPHKPKNVFHPPNVSTSSDNRLPPSYQNVQQNTFQKMSPNQNVKQNSHMHRQPYNVRPPARPVRPPHMGQPHNIRPQGPANAQEPRQNIKPQPSAVPSSQASVSNQNMSHSKGNAPPSHNIAQQQQHFQPPTPAVRQPQNQNTPQAGQQRSNAQAGPSHNPNHVPGSRHMPHSQYAANPQPPMGPGSQNPRIPPSGHPNPRMPPPGHPNSRMPPPGHPNPRMRLGQHANPGRMMRPPYPVNAGPRMGGPRYPGANPNQMRPLHPGMPHNVPGQDSYLDNFFDDDEDDEEGGMYYEDEDDEDIDADLYGKYYGNTYESEGSMSDASDEEQMLLTEYVECDDDVRAEYLYEELKARGVPPAEIEEYKQNCMRQRGIVPIPDMDYDEEMEDMDDLDDDEDDEYPDEEMVSSSTTLNTNMGGMHHSQQGHLYHDQPGSSGQRPLSKDGHLPPPPSHLTSTSSSSSHHLPPQGVLSGPRPQAAPRRPPYQRFVPNQRKPGPAPTAPPSSQPRLPSPSKSQNTGPCTNSAESGQHFTAKQSSPLPSQNSLTGLAKAPPPSSQSSTTQIPPAASAATTPSTNQSPQQPNVSTAAQMQSPSPSPRRPLPHVSTAVSSAQHTPGGDANNYGPHGHTPTFAMRPTFPRHSVPRHQHRFPPHQGMPGGYHGGHRMSQNPRLKNALIGGKGPNEAELARLAVLEMQQRLDKEIMKKKGVPTSPEHQMSPPPHFHAGRPRFPNAAAIANPSQFVRHQLPPRLPFPQTQGPRPVCSVPPFTSHAPQQKAAPGNPRPPSSQGGMGNVPRPRIAVPPPPQAGPPRNQTPRSVPPASQAAVNQPEIDQPKPSQSPPESCGGPPAQSQSQAQTGSGQQAPSAPPPPQAVPPPSPQQQHSQQPPPSQQQHSQQTPPPPKSESINLGSLSEDKFVMKEKQNFVTNMVYQIKSPIDQSSKLARWNGERFEDLESLAEKSNTPTPAKPPATQQTPPPATAMATASPAATNEQKSNQDTPSNPSTYVKPANEETKDPVAEENEDDFIFKRPLNDDEEYFRVCNRCGYTSKNFRQCEGCKHAFQGEAKYHVQKKKSSTSATASSTAASGSEVVLNNRNSGKSGGKNPRPVTDSMSPADFYGTGKKGKGRPGRGKPGRTRGGGMRGRMARKKGQDEYDSSDSEESLDQQNSAAPPEGPIKRKVGRARSKNTGPRKKSKKVDEPVTVMISSDEDEPSSTSNSLPGASPVPSPASSADRESPLFPDRDVAAPSTYGRFRRMMMEDEQGNSKMSVKLQQQALLASGLKMDEFDEDDEDEEGEEPPTYEIEIRSIRIGSMRTKPDGLLFINMRGVCFRVKSERTDEPFECEIMSQEVEYVKYYGGDSPVLFFLITHECGEKLRDIFRMKDGGDEYLDPSSTDLRQKMVVIIIESSEYLPHDMRETLSLWADINHVDDGNFIEEMSEESANDLLIQSAPPVLTADVEQNMLSFKKSYMKSEKNQNMADNEPDSTSSSPPQQTELHQYFDGPPIRLLQYPPPPARGGIPITTEDLLCLHEGEFLNDVIIDFYLQYLYQEKLTEDLQKRTHIFSSFFYKRLTQRGGQSEKTEEDVKKSLPERRHARVRKWTKTVDLFSKDFIIVPINENSHWYLAIVCFPGLASPEVVPYVPNTVHKGETDIENTETEVPEESSSAGTSEEKPSAPTAPPAPEPKPAKASKTILGKTMDPKLCLNNDDVKYSFGQKSPCILMFDSLAGPSRTPNVKMLREYLQCEWNAKKSETRLISKLLKGTTPKVPQQSNFSDCGVYLLQYVESFFEDPIADFQIPMKGLQQWFAEQLVTSKRQEIHELIMRLHRRYQEQRGDPKILDIKYDSGPPRDEHPPPFPPHMDHQYPPHPHHLPPHPRHHPPPPHHLQQHRNLPPQSLPQDEQHWQDHSGYGDPSDSGYHDPSDNYGPGPEGEGDSMDQGFMDSGDSSNSGSMADSEEQNFLFPSSQEMQAHEEQQGPASFRQGNNGVPLSEFDNFESNNQSVNNEAGPGDFNDNQNSSNSHNPGDFLTQPMPPSPQRRPPPTSSLPVVEQQNVNRENSEPNEQVSHDLASLGEGHEFQENSGQESSIENNKHPGEPPSSSSSSSGGNSGVGEECGEQDNAVKVDNKDNGSQGSHSGGQGSQ